MDLSKEQRRESMVNQIKIFYVVFKLFILKGSSAKIGILIFKIEWYMLIFKFLSGIAP